MRPVPERSERVLRSRTKKLWIFAKQHGAQLIYRLVWHSTLQSKLSIKTGTFSVRMMISCNMITEKVREMMRVSYKHSHLVSLDAMCVSGNWSAIRSVYVS